MKLLFITILLLFPLHLTAKEYSGCQDPEYIAYVDKRISLYKKRGKEAYEKALAELEGNSLDNVSESDRALFLFGNVIESARFDTTEVALEYIRKYEEIYSKTLFLFKSGDVPHRVSIARGWIALNAGNEKEAIRFLLDSTKVKGSPVLGSFGPDKSLIRELYQLGYKEEVLKYLKLSESFWHTDSAKNDMRIWRKMIKNNCAIQFAFYDTTSIDKLGL